MGLKEPGLRGSLRNTGSVTPAFFDVTITNTNSPVQEGDILTVDYSADNTGDAQDMQDIRLEIDSVQEDVDPDVMLAGGASTTGTLEWDTTGEPEAEYTATVLSNDDSDSVIVEIGSAIPDLENLQHRYASSELEFAVNDGVNPWPDEVGSEDLSGAGPTYQEGINSNPSVRYDAVDDTHQATSNSAWSFLSDGSAFSAYWVVEFFGSTDYNFFCTTQGVAGSTTVGFSVSRDNRGTNDNELFVSLANGNDNLVESRNVGEAPTNTPVIYSVTFDGTEQYQVYREKTLLDSPTATNHSTSNPDFPMHRGEPLSSTGVEEPFDGDVGEDLYYGVEHDTATRESVIDYLAQQYNITV